MRSKYHLVENDVLEMRDGRHVTLVDVEGDGDHTVGVKSTPESEMEIITLDQIKEKVTSGYGN